MDAKQLARSLDELAANVKRAGGDSIYLKLSIDEATYIASEIENLLDTDRDYDEISQEVVGDKMIPPLLTMRRLKQDAQRYRWLIQNHTWKTTAFDGGMATAGCVWHNQNVLGEEIDAAIDRDMKK